MKAPFFIFLFLIVSFSRPVIAQVNTDSLWSIYNEKSNSVENRLEALFSIDTDKRGMARPNNPDSFFHRAQLMYDLAIANDLKKWECRALLNKGNFHNRQSRFDEAFDFYSQAKEIAEDISDPELLGGSNFNQGLIYLKKSEADKGIASFDKAINYFEEINDDYKTTAAMDAIAMIYQFLKTDPHKALEYLEPSLKIKEELLKSDDSPRIRFVIAGMKQTIKSIKDSFEEIQDTIDLDTYNTEATQSKAPVEKEIKSLTEPSEPISIPIEEVERDPNLDFLYMSLKENRENGYKEYICKDLINIGVIHDGKNNLDSALFYYTKSLEISEELENKSSIATTLGYIGKVLSYKGDIEQAINVLNRGIKIFNELENESQKVSLQNIIASTYLSQKDFEKSLELYNENLIFYKSTGNNMGVAGTISNIGNVYKNQGKSEEAMSNFEEALEQFEEIKYMQGIAGVTLEIGNLQLEQKLYDQALRNMARALTISEKIKYEEGILIAQGGISSIYSAQGNHTKALSYGKRALALSQQSGNISLIMNSAKTLNNSYKAKGRYQDALKMNELYYQSRDSIQSAENQRAVIQRQVQSDYEKQKAIDDLENEKRVAIETQKKKNQQKLTFIVGIGLLLISLLALIIFNRLKITRDQKAIIEEQKKKVELSEKYKEQFLANMSHEIRTPMHAISGMVKILKRNEHLPQQDAFLNAMHTSSDNLVVILNDVLDLSKIEAGKLNIENIPMSPSSVIENVVQVLKFKAEDKGLHLNYSLDEEVPQWIMGDPGRLNQVLINLVGNAIKFTENGGIDIAVTSLSDKLRFSIKDSGIGIPKDKIDHIFGAFTQINDSTSRHYGGTGLGLSISKQLVELQNGLIWVESEENIGSTFYVDLPFVIAKQDANSELLITKERLQFMTSSLKGVRILLAEDNAFNQMIAQDDLSYLIDDVHIDVVENGSLAIEKYKTGKYDLILMDVQMPEMNGFEATRTIRLIEKTQSDGSAIPIIAMTASLLKSEVDNCYAAGMNNYIPKPYKHEELIGPIFTEIKSHQS